MYQINVVALVSDTHVTCEILNSNLGVIQAANTNLQVFSVNILVVLLEYGHAVGQFVEALRYKPEGREFNSRWLHWNFSLT